jgi:hypothetical protein
MAFSSVLLRFADLLELLEHRFVILGRDSDARVRHRDLHAAVRQRHPHVDASALWRELHGVGEQVQQYLLHLALIGADFAEALVHLPLQSDAATGSSLPHQQQRIVDG